MYVAGSSGAGNMGGARASAAARQVTREKVAVACSSPAHSAAAAERLGVSQTTFLKWANAENLPKK